MWDEEEIAALSDADVIRECAGRLYGEGWRGLAARLEKIFEQTLKEPTEK